MAGVNAQRLCADGRPGAVSLNEPVGETGYARYSSMKCPVFAGNSGGTAEM